MTEIRKIRKAVATMANKLHKAGLSLSEAFKKAWRRVKQSMTFRISGTTYNNGQRKLSYISQFEDVEIRLEHEADNSFDSNAVKVWAILPAIRKMAPIGYIPRTIAAEIAALIDKGIQIKAAGHVIGGYADKENYGYLLTLSF